MFGIELFKGMTDDDIEKVVRSIFDWYRDRCPNIKANCDFNKSKILSTYIKRLHLYTYMKPLILAALFNIRFDINTQYIHHLFMWEDYPVEIRKDITNCVFNPGKFHTIVIDDHIVSLWTDDIRDGHEIALLFREWWVNSLITHYLDRKATDMLSLDEQTEFYKLLEAEIADELSFNFIKTDHRHSPENVRHYLNLLFESVDSYLEKNKSNRSLLL